MSRRFVVVGAGVGGLTAAALLARAGLDVTLLEAHVSPGGCAATFFHRGYRFDAGATLPAGFYPGGPMDRLGRELGIERWPVRPVDPAMVVHLPQGDPVALHAGRPGAPNGHAGLGPNADAFWRWQEATADALWDLALRNPPWPPQTAGQAAAERVLPGTPVTFQRYTRRAWGWVGGFPQTSLTRAWGPRLAPGLWLVGDSIFPGQSVPAVALGGLRVAQAILDDLS